MSPLVITFVLIFGALGMFIWNRVPAVLVAVGVSLVLFFTGILPVNQALGGFGDLTVIFIATLFVVAAGLEASGVTTWAGQVLVAKAGQSRTRLMLFIMLLAGLFCSTISVNATVAALLPLVIVVAVRLGIPTSQLLLPMCFATHGATMLTLIGAPLNVLASNAAEGAGFGRIGFFEFAVIGLPMFAGTLAIILLTRGFLLPKTSGQTLPPDFSAHASTLVDQYQLDSGLHRLRVRAGSPSVGKPAGDIDLNVIGGLSLVGVQDGASGKLGQRPALAEGDVLMVRGDAGAAALLASEHDLALSAEDSAGSVAETLFNRNSGLAEVVIPARSKLIGQTVFPGMSARDGSLLVLAIQRGGEDLAAKPTPLVVGDHLLLQGAWPALEQHLADPQVLAVDSPEIVRRQAIALGLGAKEALGVLAALVVMLIGGWFPGAVSGLVCAMALILLGVLTVPQAYKSIDWNTCFLVAGMIPLAAAMTKTGAADLIADQLISLAGGAGPRALLAGLFVVTLAITSVMSNTATALLMFPIAIATAHELHLSPMPFVIGIAVSAHAALLTPVATPVNLMVLGPGGYKFADYTKFGLPIAIWWLAATLLFVPIWWHF